MKQLFFYAEVYYAMMSMFLSLMFCLYGMAWPEPLLPLVASKNGGRAGGNIAVTVKKIDPQRGGTVKIALFRGENFPKIGRHFAGSEQPANQTERSFLLQNIETGNYALAVFQDVNNDNQLNFNILGMPTEPFGFSNDAPLRFGPPHYHDAKFAVLPDATVQLVVHLR